MIKKIALIDEMETLIINTHIIKGEAETCLNIQLEPDECEEILDAICDDFCDFIREEIWAFIDGKENNCKCNKK